MMTARLKNAVHKVFGPTEASMAAERLDHHCDVEKLHTSSELIERIGAAALKRSQGSLEKLEAALELAQRDWRDLLMTAGFGHDLLAHEAWLAQFAPPQR